MNMFEEAAAIAGMLKMCSMTQSQIAKKMGVSQSYVANKLRLLRFSDEVRRKILDTGLCERQVRQLLKLDCEEDVLFAIRKISERGMTVAESEVIVDMLVETEVPKRLSRLDARERIDSFESFINSSLESLNSIGIHAKKRVDTYNNKRYITISIEELQDISSLKKEQT